RTFAAQGFLIAFLRLFEKCLRFGVGSGIKVESSQRILSLGNLDVVVRQIVFPNLQRLLQQVTGVLELALRRIGQSQPVQAVSERQKSGFENLFADVLRALEGLLGVYVLALLQVDLTKQGQVFSH